MTRETSFYSEQGGQAGDRGAIVGEGGRGGFRVEDTQREGGVVRHYGVQESGEVLEGQEVCLELEADWRVGCMRSHTATHLLNRVLHKILPVTAQRSSHVMADNLR